MKQPEGVGLPDVPAASGHNGRAGDQLNDKDFNRLIGLVREQYGIRITPIKKAMVETRLRRRMRQLGVDTIGEYIKYLFDEQKMAEELMHLSDVITTNKTDFFREPDHYHYLVDYIVPEFLEGQGLNGERLCVWSAGCSTGEEPYTLAIVLNEFAEKIAAFPFTIYASDISGAVIEKARRAVYDRSRLEPVPPALQQRYFLQSKDRSREEVRVKPTLRALVNFQRINLNDRRYNLPTRMDVVFFRNVIIYFSRETQREIVGRVCSYLKPGGYLFMGHAESLFGLNLPLDQVAPTIYRRRSR